MNTPTPDYPQKVGSVDSVLTELVDPESEYHLVLIHGIADSSNVWRDMCQCMEIKFKSYQEMTLPWNSAVGDDISYEPKPEDVLRQAWRSLPEGPKIVLAHSFGANSFVQMAQSESIDDVHAIVLLSIYSKPKFSDFTWPLFKKYINDFDKFIEMSIEVRSQSKKISDVSMKIIKEKTIEMYNPPSWVQFYVLFSTTPNLDLTPFTMPTLVAGGSNDFSILREDIEEFSSRIPGSVFNYIEHCGHFSMLEDPPYTANIVQNFIQKGINNDSSRCV